jgi:hypothetical protein
MRNIQSIIQNRYFIADQSLIIEMEEQFTALTNNAKNWTKTYLDNVTGQKWLSYRVDSSIHGGGTQVFCKLPVPETEKLVDLIVTSEHDDEIFAACRTLVENEEIRKLDFRLNLIARLEQLTDKSKLISIIEYTGLDSPLNRRDIIGKSYDEIVSDSKYYQEIANRSKKFL